MRRPSLGAKNVGSSPDHKPYINVELGFLVATVLTMVSKPQDSSNKPQMDYGRLNIYPPT